MEDAIDFSTPEQNEIRSQLSEIFELIPEDHASLYGSVAVNSWGDGYDSEQAFDALSGFFDNVAPENVRGRYLKYSQEKEVAGVDFSLEVRDLIADILNISFRDKKLSELVKGWRTEFKDEEVLSGLHEWYRLNKNSIMTVERRN